MNTAAIINLALRRHRLKGQVIPDSPAMAIMLLVLLCVASPPAFSRPFALELPGDDFHPGWRKSEPALSFEAKNLYGYIDGGAELFLEFGFKELMVQRYSRGEQEVSLDLYQMAGPDAALAIYLAKKGVEQPVPGVPCRNTGGPYQITALKGRCFIQVTDLSGKKEVQPVMIKLLRSLLVNIPEEAARDWLEGLPAGRIPGSELLVAGPYSLQMVYTLAEGDVLQLGGRVTGVCVELEDAVQGKRTFLRIDYPDTAAAAAAFENIKNNLDEYLTRIEAGSDTLTFQDYQGKFGRVVRNKKNIEIELHLSQL